MSQRDLVAELRAAHVEAPPEVRERVRLIAAAAPAPPRRITWRRALVVVVPVAAAIAATIVVTRPPKHEQTALDLARRSGPVTIAPSVGATAHSPSAKALAVPSAKARVQTYDAERCRSASSMPATCPTASSAHSANRDVARRLLAVGARGDARESRRRRSEAQDPTLTIQTAMAQLGQLGTITDENVSTVDKTALLNATDREIARLQKQLATLRAEPQSADTDRRIAALVTRIERLQRAARRRRGAQRTTQLSTSISRRRSSPSCRSTSTAHCTVSVSRSRGSGSAPSMPSPSVRRSRCCSCSCGSASASCGGAARTRSSRSRTRGARRRGRSERRRGARRTRG